jgi:hypothetical protein
MSNKRRPITFPELDELPPKGRGAILRSAEEVQAEQRLQEQSPAQTVQSPDDESIPPHSPQAEDESKQVKKKANKLASNPASMLASYHDDVVETIRKAVKTPGKEVSFVRLTAEEKTQLADIVYTYKRQGKKTSENEINRIAINYILEDYRANGERSILARVIASLLA